MDLGAVGGVLLIIAAIFSGLFLANAPMDTYVNAPSVFIVIVGTFGAVMLSHRPKTFFSSLRNIRHAFSLTTTNVIETIDNCIELADKTRKGGFLALEESDVNDPFLAKAKTMMVDGHSEEAVNLALTKEIYLTKERNQQSIKVLRSFSDIAPAMGMIGTLIGLVDMLIAMEDPKSIGPAMAVALLTTLYGALIANGITTPLANKLSERSDEILMHQSLIKDAVLKMMAGDNPRVMFDYLQTYIDEKLRRPQEAVADIVKETAG